MTVDIPEACNLCPRRCGVDRNTGTGFCGCGNTLKAARAALHMWEEPCISGTNGSGTVFFSGCTLKCCYCQNWNISAEGFGKEITSERLSGIFLELQDKGAHNINLVTPTQWLPWIIPALKLAKRNGLTIPIVYNTGGYETEETVSLLSEYVDIWLADIKYFSHDLSLQYSCASDYFEVCSKAVRKMMDSAGPLFYSEDGKLLKRGTILRHLVLPGCVQDSMRVLDYISGLPRDRFLLSLMSQYTPFYKAKEDKKLNRRITSYEYNKVLEYAVDKGLSNGFMQEKSSAKEEYTPAFDLYGV